jgi:hypothetical protein
MTSNRVLQLFPDKDVVLRNASYFIWPEPRWHTGRGHYDHLTPFDSFIKGADLINGVLVGTAGRTVECLKKVRIPEAIMPGITPDILEVT